VEEPFDPFKIPCDRDEDLVPVVETPVVKNEEEQEAPQDKEAPKRELEQPRVEDTAAGATGEDTKKQQQDLSDTEKPTPAQEDKKQEPVAAKEDNKKEPVVEKVEEKVKEVVKEEKKAGGAQKKQDA